MYAKKSLGQNFLKSKSALKSIVAAGNLNDKDVVLEIGPGRGALTEPLLASGAKVIAVEKDRTLISYLNNKFHKEIASGQLNLIEGDILEQSSESLGLKRYKLMANIPYYITGEVIRKFSEEHTQPEIMVLLVQKEVADRIVSKDGKESILSISVKAYASPEMVAKVPRGAFDPIPNVDSAIIALKGISKDKFVSNKISEKDFFEIVKSGFAHKRKKLGGNLKPIAHKVNVELLQRFRDKRAEDLSLEDWFALSTT